MRKIHSWTLLYGTFTNWIFTLLAALFGTSKTTPLAGAGFQGSDAHEMLVAAGLGTVALTMIFALIVLIYGLRGRE